MESKHGTKQVKTHSSDDYIKQFASIQRFFKVVTDKNSIVYSIEVNKLKRLNQELQNHHSTGKLANNTDLLPAVQDLLKKTDTQDQKSSTFSFTPGTPTVLGDKKTPTFSFTPGVPTVLGDKKTPTFSFTPGIPTVLGDKKTPTFSFTPGIPNRLNDRYTDRRNFLWAKFQSLVDSTDQNGLVVLFELKDEVREFETSSGQQITTPSDNIDLTYLINSKIEELQATLQSLHEKNKRRPSIQIETVASRNSRGVLTFEENNEPLPSSNTESDLSEEDDEQDNEENNPTSYTRVGSNSEPGFKDFTRPVDWSDVEQNKFMEDANCRNCSYNSDTKKWECEECKIAPASASASTNSFYSTLQTMAKKRQLPNYSNLKQSPSQAHTKSRNSID